MTIRIKVLLTDINLNEHEEILLFPKSHIPENMDIMEAVLMDFGARRDGFGILYETFESGTAVMSYDKTMNSLINRIWVTMKPYRHLKEEKKKLMKKLYQQKQKINTIREIRMIIEGKKN